MSKAVAAPGYSGSKILSVRLQSERDIVGARRRARQISELLGLTETDQSALATAVSEVARNAIEYAEGGLVDFSVARNFLWVEISDSGGGIVNLDAILNGRYVSRTGLGIGLAGSRRLTEGFTIHSSPSGTRVRFGKAIPASAPPVDLAKLSQALAAPSSVAPEEEIRFQNRDLIRAFENLQTKEAELQTRQAELQRLSLELEETNRGVVALYAELEERAGALRRATELKSQFLSHVSHEFRTPVNSIMALTHILLRRADGDLTAEQEKQVAFIRQAADGLAEMVNDLLDLAKVESGKNEVRLNTVEASQVMGAVRALMRPLATNDAVSLIFEDLNPPVLLVTDEAKLGQILRNLVSNALKFTERGEVRVCAREISGGRIQFSVADTGIGIAAEDLPMVFEEFAQVHHSMQRKVKGTGLGLSLSRKLAGLLGGVLEAQSEPGVGSTFVLTLPLRTNAAATRTPVANSGQATILIVDDEEPARYVTRQLFRGPNYRVIESDALEAAERARFERPDLIVLDLMMPARTGFEVLDELKSDPMTSGIPVVIHTSKVMTPADLHRLGGRHSELLPKSGPGRKQALETMRVILNDPALFSHEPEFFKANEGSE